MRTKDKNKRIKSLVRNINNFITNMELDSGADWSQDDIVSKGLEKIVESDQLESVVLSDISDDETVVLLLSDDEVSINYESVEKKIMDQLSAYFSKDEKKEVLYILYRVQNLNKEESRKNMLSKKEKELRKKLFGMNPSIDFKRIKFCYMCDTNFEVDDIILEEVNRYNLLEMPQNDGRINFSMKSEEKRERNITGYVMSV